MKRRKSELTTIPKSDAEFQISIVHLISVKRHPEEALELLAQHYRVRKPELKIGLPKGEKHALGCYVQRDNTIYIAKEEYLYDPYVLIHEFYHHLRHVGGKHRGTERHARDFALRFLQTTRMASWLESIQEKKM
jgi:Zn-dependent peptidase ImmA (M78 family)